MSERVDHRRHEVQRAIKEEANIGALIIAVHCADLGPLIHSELTEPDAQASSTPSELRSTGPIPMLLSSKVGELSSDVRKLSKHVEVGGRREVSRWLSLRKQVRAGASVTLPSVAAGQPVPVPHHNGILAGMGIRR